MWRAVRAAHSAGHTATCAPGFRFSSVCSPKLPRKLQDGRAPARSVLILTVTATRRLRRLILEAYYTLVWLERKCMHIHTHTHTQVSLSRQTSVPMMRCIASHVNSGTCRHIGYGDPSWPAMSLPLYLQLPRRGKQIDVDVDGGDHSDAHMHTSTTIREFMLCPSGRGSQQPAERPCVLCLPTWTRRTRTATVLIDLEGRQTRGPPRRRPPVPSSHRWHAARPYQATGGPTAIISLAATAAPRAPGVDS